MNIQAILDHIFFVENDFFPTHAPHYSVENSTLIFLETFPLSIFEKKYYMMDTLELIYIRVYLLKYTFNNLIIGINIRHVTFVTCTISEEQVPLNVRMTAMLTLCSLMESLMLSLQSRKVNTIRCICMQHQCNLRVISTVYH